MQLNLKTSLSTSDISDKPKKRFKKKIRHRYSIIYHDKTLTVIIRERKNMQKHVLFLKSKTHALWYLCVLDDAYSESGVLILHVIACLGHFEK